jgi:magnesium transporter
MLSRHAYRGITWIDLESPTPSEVRQVMDEFSIHPAVAEELLVASYKSKVDRHDDYIYLILHFPAFGSRLSGAMQEVDFIVGKKFLITTRYGVMDPFLRFARIFEANSLLDGSNTPITAGTVFLYMIRNLYQALDGELEYLSLDLRKVEEQIFAGNERDMVFELSRISRALLTFKQALAPHHGMLDSLDAIGARFFGQDFSIALKSALTDFHRVSESLVSEREVLQELRDTNDSLLTTKQNETTKHLTMMAFVTFPLTLLAGIFGMNTTHIPIVGMPFDFEIVVGLMFMITGAFFLFFKYRKWL